MAEKKPGFFKRLFKFGKKKEPQEELEVVEDATSDTALGDTQAPDPVAHAEAAANVIVDTEAGADLDDKPGIEPIVDTPPPPAEAGEQQREAERARLEAQEQERRDAEDQARREAELRQAEEERLAAEKREAAEKAEAERVERERVEEQKRAEAQAEAARQEQEEREAQAEQERREAQEVARREELEKQERERQRLEEEKLEEERREKERLEAERAQAEAERLAEQEEAERLEREQREKEEAARKQAEEKRLSKERAEAERKAAEQERLDREEAERVAAQIEAERLEEEKAKHAAEAVKAEAEAAKPQGVFEAPGETNTSFDGDTPAPLSDSPEPPPAPTAGQAEPQEEPEKKLSWFKRLKGGLSRSSTQLTDSISDVFTKRKLDDDTLQDLEDVLIRADLGVETAMSITEKLASQRMGKDVSSEEVRGIMADEIESVLEPVAAELELDLDHQPHVILVVGVNGSGKTTTIGKLSQKLYDAGFSTLLVAGDTFRAAAIEQLKIWGDRTQSPVLSRPLGSDAAGLAFDAYTQAKEEGRDVMLMDTAGRLQNRTELMDELAKIVRVLKKQDPAAPHTVLLTLDATTGQNALNQVEIFKDVAGVNGIVMTKLDGTARGGILVAIASKFKLPIFFLGVGEQVDDLEPFEAKDFARSIAGLV